MCFGYLYNLHSLNGIDGVAEPDSGSDDEPPTRNVMNTSSKFMFSTSKKKEFKLYNDFSHCPIISTQTWVKKSETPVPLETLKRQISQIDNDKTTTTTEYGPTEKKRKENGTQEFDLNKEEGSTHDNSTTPSEHASEAFMAAVADKHARDPLNNVTHHEYLNPTLSQNLLKNYIKLDPPNSNQHMDGAPIIPDNNRGLHPSTNTDDDEDDSYEDGESDSDAADTESSDEGMEIDGKTNYYPTGNAYMTKKRVDSNDMRPQFNQNNSIGFSNQSYENIVRNNYAPYPTNSSNQQRVPSSSQEDSATEDDTDCPTETCAPHTQ
jgi:hypothetical protein